jgi:K+-sensing histidine kinase KdpD
MEMLNQVLDVARLDSKQMAVSPEPTEMPTFFEGLLRLWSPIAEQKGLSFRMEIDPDIPEMLDVDVLRLRQCMNNLLSNAVKFTDEGFVLLSARWDVRDGSPTRLLVEVTDTGIGMAPDAAKRVFAPFEQVDRRIERSYGGAGLGLSITRNLARLMGGNLTFKSVADEGSIFTLTVLGVESELPQMAEDEIPMMGRYVLSEVTDDPVEDAATETCDGDGVFHAVVADDLATNRFIAVSYLRTLGVETEEVENGADAVGICPTQMVYGR